MGTGSSLVVGGNNGDRDGTKQPGRKNDPEKMFDWTGGEKTSMWRTHLFE